MYRNLVKIKVKGLNLDKLINFLMQNYDAYEIDRLAYDEMSLKLPYVSYKNLLLKTKNSCYTISVEKTYGMISFASYLKKNIAYFISFFICMGMCLLFHTRLLKISVYGTTTYQSEIMQVLEDNGVKLYQSTNIDVDLLEQEILQKVDEISMVSIAIKGNVLLINAKEKLPDVDIAYEDFVAPYNLIVTNIECYQGSLQKNVGDLVRQGEVIVSATISNADGTTTNVKPIYNLSAETYFTGQVTFTEIETTLVRTGKKITSSSFLFMDKEFLKITKTNKFDLMEEEVKVTSYTNMFIPLKVKKTIFYELREVSVTHNFENEKQALFLQSKEIAYEKLPEGLKVEETTQNISEYNNTKLVQTFLKVNLELTND